MIWAMDNVVSPDTHCAFRGVFYLKQRGMIELRICAASWYVLWLDGQYLCEGPARFVPDYPEYDVRQLTLDAGPHLLAVQVHHQGLATRMLPDIAPFLHCRIMDGNAELPIRWRCHPLAGYRPQVHRINPQFGWVEWCDTRSNPADWQRADFVDTAWDAPVKVEVALGPLRPASIGAVRQFDHALTSMATGVWAEDFGYETDDPSARFFFRDLVCDTLPATGTWRRYDLGRVRLGRPRLLLDLPAGTLLEIGYAEALRHNRVAPYITLSAGPSCNLDHLIARGGVQEFFPLHPKGGRFLEVHISAPPDEAHFLQEVYQERGYHGEPEGAFTCSDDLLNRIWATGIDTYRACAEDAIIDNPTRERGQWVGDAIIGGETTSVAYADLRLMRRCLVQTAQCAREDGLVPGMTTGGLIFVSSYALQWVEACLRYVELTGDDTLLDELYAPALRNLQAFAPFVTEQGLGDGVSWAFVDWGYVRGDTPIDLAVNLYYLGALRAMARWCAGRNDAETEQQMRQQEQMITAALTRELTAPMPEIGYHAAVLGLRLGFFADTRQQECIQFIKSHLLNCFPNNPAAPRLSDPTAACAQLITPYFAHTALPPLIRHGEIDFVLEQYRNCWGWMLAQGMTTWAEVFDTRWSHCHQWSAAPSWQLSRFVLGLHPRFDLGLNHFVLDLHPGSLTWAHGTLPLANGVVTVDWSRQGEKVVYQVTATTTIWLHEGQPDTPNPAVIAEIHGTWQTTM